MYNTINNKSESNSEKKNVKNQNLNKSLENNITTIVNIFKNDETIVIREFSNKKLKAAQCCIIYIEGMVNPEMVSENIIQPILRNDLTENIESNNLLEEINGKVIISNNVTMESDISRIISSIINGDTLLLIQGYDRALVVSTKGWQSRTISEPESAKVIRGPREGFTESIMVNLTMLRRKIKSPDLKFKFKDIGVRTNTKTCLCYIDGLVDKGILSQFEFRLNEINIDGIIDSGYIQELIKDAPFSPFETVGSDERPDVIAAKLLEGRVALFVDGSPFVLTVPYLFVENFQANEDYYNNFITSSINRFIRGATAFLAITIPAIYLSIVTFHQEMLPTPLLLSISAARQDVPIPTAISLFLMLVIFDVIREASTRMPSHINQAIAIIGTIVLGQAAVEARLVSAPVLIITALTGITTLINYNLVGASFVFRNILLLGSSILGIYGFFMCLMILFLHLMSIRSFGVPYMLSMTKFRHHEAQDTWVRSPWWTMKLRPKIIAAKNIVRQTSKK